MIIAYNDLNNHQHTFLSYRNITQSICYSLALNIELISLGGPPGLTDGPTAWYSSVPLLCERSAHLYNDILIIFI